MILVNLGVTQGLGSNNKADPDVNNNIDATSFSTASYTPPSSGLIIACISAFRTSGGSDIPTVTGNGITWNNIKTLAATTALSMAIFAANASGSIAGALTFDYGANIQQHCRVSLFYITGVHLAGGVLGAFVQTPSNNGSGTSGSVPLVGASNSNNRPISFFVHAANEVSSQRTNWTLIDDIRGSAFTTGNITQMREDIFETTASASWVTSAGWGGIAAEIKAQTTLKPMFKGFNKGTFKGMS